MKKDMQKPKRIKGLSKQLVVASLEVRDRMEGRYQLVLEELNARGKHQSTLTLTKKDLIRFRLDPREELVGTTVELKLKPVPYSPENPEPDAVLITELSRSAEIKHLYATIPPAKSEYQSWRLQAKTPVSGGALAVMPSTYYHLDLSLTKGEYRRLAGLPADSALQVEVKPAGQRLRDVVLRCRGTLDNPRVFPEAYAERMIPLVRAMIDYFGGDVDVVGHYCGLDTRDKEIAPKGTSLLGRMTRHREFFAVDSLSAEDWEKNFVGSIAHIDETLRERYDNRLPIKDVDGFYDHVETSTWESKKHHPIEELTVGLEAGNVFRGGYHLPSLFIEARSVTGNRKACEEACEVLSAEALKLFGVRFDHLLWSIEENAKGNFC